MKSVKFNQEKKSRDFIEEYKVLMTKAPIVSGLKLEWSQPGDKIEKYTVYEEYTPVKTSTETTFYI